MISWGGGVLGGGEGGDGGDGGEDGGREKGLLLIILDRGNSSVPAAAGG